jgi:hypothetical protein
MSAVGEVLVAQAFDEAFLGLFQDVSKGPRAPQLGGLDQAQ